MIKLITLSILIFNLAAAPATLNISSQVAIVKDMVTAANYKEAAAAIIGLRRNAVASTKEIPMDFSGFKIATVATPALLFSALDDALHKSILNDLSGTAHALDRAQVLAAALNRGLPPDQRFAQQVARVDDEVRNSKTREASPSALVDAARTALEAGNPSGALQYCQRFFETGSRMQGSQSQHWAHTVRGLSYFKLGDESNAVADLLASARVSGLGTTFLPSLSLAQAVAPKNPKSVAEYLDLVTSRNPNWKQSLKVPGWKAALAKGQTPQFGDVAVP